MQTNPETIKNHKNILKKTSKIVKCFWRQLVVRLHVLYSNKKIAFKNLESKHLC